MPESLGTLADGRYRLESILGQGGMAVVYAAWDSRLEVRRAVKVLLPAMANNAPVRRRFEREARVMARLHHPHILTVHDVGTDGARVYIVMELLRGGSLADLMEHDYASNLEEEHFRGMDPALRGLIRTATAYHPDQRFASAQQMALAIRAVREIMTDPERGPLPPLRLPPAEEPVSPPAPQAGPTRTVTVDGPASEESGGSTFSFEANREPSVQESVTGSTTTATAPWTRTTRWTPRPGTWTTTGMGSGTRGSPGRGGGRQIRVLALRAGEVNGDGLDDILIGAPYNDTRGGSGSGAAYLLLSPGLTP